MAEEAGRTISVTDAAGAVTTTVYDALHDLPAMVTDALGNTSCYKYDALGRKIADSTTQIYRSFAQRERLFCATKYNHITLLRRTVAFFIFFT